MSQKSDSLLKGYPRSNAQEGLYVAWKTKPELLAQILPPPLKMVAPVVWVYIVHIGEPSYTQHYCEAAMSVPATYDGVKGEYVRSLLLYGPGAQMSAFSGRDVMGTPKKIADDIRIIRTNRYVRAYIERDGIKIIDVEGKLGEYNTPEANKALGKLEPGTQADHVAWFYKFDMDQGPDGKTTFSNARLLKHTTRTFYKSWETGAAKVSLNPSVNDPWADLEVEEVLGFGYSRNDLHMISSETLVSENTMEVIPYLLSGRYDVGVLGKPSRRFP